MVGTDTIREQGYHTTIDTVKGATGVVAGDVPNDASFAMRGFQGNQVNVTYNGINIGPTGFTALTMETFNLDRVEFLKGPSSLMSGQGAVGGAINYVTKAPHAGAIANEAFIGFDSLGSIRTGYGSGAASTSRVSTIGLISAAPGRTASSTTRTQTTGTFPDNLTTG